MFIRLQKASLLSELRARAEGPGAEGPTGCNLPPLAGSLNSLFDHADVKAQRHVAGRGTHRTLKTALINSGNCRRSLG